MVKTSPTQFLCNEILLDNAFDSMYSQLNTRDVFKKGWSSGQDMIWILTKAFNSIDYHYTIINRFQQEI